MKLGVLNWKKQALMKKKGIFYGKLDFHSGVVSFRKNETDIKKLCSGYFIFDMNTGIYEGNLSLVQLREKMTKLKLPELESFKDFIKKRGKKQKCAALDECELPVWIKS